MSEQHTFSLISTLSDCWGKCHLTFLEVAGKTGCFPATSCAPKYVFTRNIGINSPFLRAINLFSYSPQDGTSSRHFVLSPPDADDADSNTILVKLDLWELVIVFNKTFWSATNLCLRYASAKCGR